MNTTHYETAPPDGADAMARLLTAAEYQTARAHVFPGLEAWRWFVRQHREALQEAGALLYIRGRLMVDPLPFDGVVVEQGKRAARRVGGGSVNVPDFETGDALAKQRATVAAQAARQGLQLFALADGRLLLVRADLQRVVPDLRAARLVLAQLAEGAT